MVDIPHAARRERWAGMPAKARDDLVADTLDDHEIEMRGMAREFKRLGGHLTRAAIAMGTASVLIAVDVVVRVAA